MDKENVLKTARFFRRRFPEKDLLFEMECGYFFEWCDRFESGYVESYCDEESLKVVKELR